MFSVVDVVEKEEEEDVRCSIERSGDVSVVALPVFAFEFVLVLALEA